MQNNYSTKLKKDMLESLVSAIEIVINAVTPEDLDDKLLLASLHEIMIKGKQKLIQLKPSYNITFSPAQAFAICLLSDYYVTDKKSYLGNKLHILHNEIIKKYSS